MISAERLRKLMHYEPDTGDFLWRERSAGRPVGRPAGSNKQRYRQIHIDYCHYQAHRLAWLYMTGEWPQEIDHIDRNGFNNRPPPEMVGTSKGRRPHAALGLL